MRLKIMSPSLTCDCYRKTCKRARILTCSTIKMRIILSLFALTLCSICFASEADVFAGKWNVYGSTTTDIYMIDDVELHLKSFEFTKDKEFVQHFLSETGLVHSRKCKFESDEKNLYLIHESESNDSFTETFKWVYDGHTLILTTHVDGSKISPPSPELKKTDPEAADLLEKLYQINSIEGMETTYKLRRITRQGKSE